MNTLPLLAVSSPLLLATATAQTILIQEGFSTNPPTDTPAITWSTNNSGYETYSDIFANSSDGMGDGDGYDMSPGYDHDNDPATDTILIPGGLEINGDIPDAQVTATVTLPADLDSTQPGTFSFHAGLRTSVVDIAPTITVTTQAGTEILNAVPTINANDNIWQFNPFSLDLTTTAPGETLAFTWTGGGSTSEFEQTASGLQITDVQFLTQPVPEPTAAILSLLGFATIFRRARH